MAKYLQFTLGASAAAPYAAGDTIDVPAANILCVEGSGATTIDLWEPTGNKKYRITNGAAMSAALGAEIRESICAAMKLAAETNWREVTFPVDSAQASGTLDIESITIV